MINFQALTSREIPGATIRKRCRRPATGLARKGRRFNSKEWPAHWNLGHCLVIGKLDIGHFSLDSIGAVGDALF